MNDLPQPPMPYKMLPAAKKNTRRKEIAPNKTRSTNRTSLGHNRNEASTSDRDTSPGGQLRADSISPEHNNALRPEAENITPSLTSPSDSHVHTVSQSSSQPPSQSSTSTETAEADSQAPDIAQADVPATLGSADMDIARRLDSEPQHHRYWPRYVSSSRGPDHSSMARMASTRNNAVQALVALIQHCRKAWRGQLHDAEIADTVHPASRVDAMKAKLKRLRKRDNLTPEDELVLFALVGLLLEGEALSLKKKLTPCGSAIAKRESEEATMQVFEAVGRLTLDACQKRDSEKSDALLEEWRRFLPQISHVRREMPLFFRR